MIVENVLDPTSNQEVVIKALVKKKSKFHLSRVGSTDFGKLEPGFSSMHSVRFDVFNDTNKIRKFSVEAEPSEESIQVFKGGQRPVVLFFLEQPLQNLFPEQKSCRASWKHDHASSESGNFDIRGTDQRSDNGTNDVVTTLASDNLYATEIQGIKSSSVNLPSRCFEHCLMGKKSSANYASFTIPSHDRQGIIVSVLLPSKACQEGIVRCAPQRGVTQRNFAADEGLQFRFSVSVWETKDKDEAKSFECSATIIRKHTTKTGSP